MRAWLVALGRGAYVVTLYAASAVLSFTLLGCAYFGAVLCCASLSGYGDPVAAFAQGMMVVGAAFLPIAMVAAIPLAFFADKFRRALCSRLPANGGEAAS